MTTDRQSADSRGSTYHHFPGGKKEMYTAALDLASDRAVSTIEDVRGQPARVVVERFVEMWRTLLTTADLRLGCAASLLVDGGCPAAQAPALAALTIAANGRRRRHGPVRG